MQIFTMQIVLWYACQPLKFKAMILMLGMGRKYETPGVGAQHTTYVVQESLVQFSESIKNTCIAYIQGASVISIINHLFSYMYKLKCVTQNPYRTCIYVTPTTLRDIVECVHESRKCCCQYNQTVNTINVYTTTLPVFHMFYNTTINIIKSLLKLNLLL